MQSLKAVNAKTQLSFRYFLYIILEENSYMIKEQLFWCSGETAK